ncbi:MAG: hypothetical protein B7Z73_02550 [Planctomycetia bacterium 21-64-5]|nr:MAG: hypothetical protein B7Z73_02550 [Planctomycetia bacterium 21-64-5]
MSREATMPTLQDFDVRSRGVAMLVEDWEAKHAAVRQTWKVEDLLKLVVDAVSTAADVHAASLESGAPPLTLADRISKLAYFLRLLEQLMVSASLIEDRICVFESEGYSVANADHLRQAISRLSEIVIAVRAALEEAEWQELDQQALSTQELLEIRDYLRATGQASA